MKYVWIPGAILWVIVSLIANVNVVHAQDITFEVTADKTQMYVEDVLELSFTVSGGNLDLNVTPELPDFKGDFDVVQGPGRSTRISIMNGKQSSSLTLQYLLSPKKTGTLTIGPAKLQYNDKTYTTKPLTIQVVQGARPQAPAPSTESPQAGENSGTVAAPDMYLRAEIDKETVYIGEQVTLSCYVYTRVNIAGYELTQQPSFTGFWVEDLQIPQPPKLQAQTINGVQYGVALLKKVALFPTASGEVTIDPMAMTFSVTVHSRQRNPRDPFDMFNDPFDDFFARTQQIVRKTQPITLKILPLPDADRPAAFNGNVGNFTMSVELDRTEVKQDEPLNLTIKIQGTGNIKTLKEPPVKLPDSFKRYDPEITENIFQLQEPIQGEKTFKSTIISSVASSVAGTYQIEPVEFAYFDPQRKAYQTLRSQAFDVTILPGAKAEEPVERRITTKEEIKLLGQDIRFIKTDIPRLVNQGTYWYQSGVFLTLLILPLLLIGSAYGYKQYHQKYGNDERYLRKKKAKKLSQTHLKTAHTLMNRGESKEFYAAISTALRQYLGNKFNLSPAGIMGSEISQELVTQGLDEDTANLLTQCLADCDFARFAPVGSSVGEMHAMLRNAETIIERVEKLKVKGSGFRVQGSKTLIMFILLPFTFYLLPYLPCFAEVTPEALFQQANKLYETGAYAQATESYQAILDSGLKNGYVYYNLGNALLKQKRVAEAILAYERAKRYLPRDEDVTFNLDYARAATLDKMGQWDSGKIAGMMAAILDSFTPNEVSLFFLIMYLVLTILGVLFIFVSRLWRIRITYGAILPGLLVLCSGLLLGFQISQHTTVQEAILLTPKTEARTGPGEGYSTVFEIHEGAKVRIQREKLDWVEIKLPNKVIGWVMKKDIKSID
jgi:tetratricopeptide (TPR) repeat protein